MNNASLILASTVFFLFVINLSGLAGAGYLNELNIEGFNTGFNAPSNTTAFNPLSGLVMNFQVFFTLMAVNSGFFLFGTVLIAAYALMMFYIFAQLIRGSGG